jgi:hypothetical protein
MGHSSFERVVGNVSATEKEKIKREFDDQFDDQAFESLIGKEREKTPEELRIIALANEATNKVRREHGLDDFVVPAQNIHIIKDEEWPKHRKESAIYISTLQGVVLREQDANLVSLEKILHEMVHFKSHNAAQVTKSEEPELMEYRGGLRVNTRDGKTGYFRTLNEAVTEELTIELMSKVLHDPLFEKEIKQTEDLGNRYPDAATADGKPLFDDDTYYARLADRTTLKDRVGRLVGQERSRTISVAHFTYQRERNILSELIDKLFERNAQKFHNPDEVAALFTGGLMTGNILPIGRLIDGTFGKRTLRKIGELDSDIDAQEKFVNSL